MTSWILAVISAFVLTFVILRVLFPTRYERWVDLENDFLRRIRIFSEEYAERSKRFEKSRTFLVLMLLLLASIAGLWILRVYLREARNLSVGVAPAATRFSGGTTRATVPLRLVDYRPLVAASINGHGPFLFLVDTGAPITIVSHELAERLDLKRVSNRLALGDGTSTLW